MVARFKANVSGSPFCSIPRSAERVCFRVGATQLLMPTLGDYLSLPNQNAPDHGVWMHPSPSIAANLNRPLKESPVTRRKVAFHMVLPARSEGQAKCQGPEFGAGRGVEPVL